PTSQLSLGLLPLFGRSRGPYAFYGDVDLVGSSEDVRTGAVEVLPLIAASLRGSSRDDVVRAVCEGFGVAKVHVSPDAELDTLGLLEEERRLVDRLRAQPM